MGMEKSMNDAFNIFHVLHELFLQIRVFAPRCFNPAAALFRTCLTITLSISVYSWQWFLMASSSELQGCSKVKSAIYPLWGQWYELSISLPILVLNESNLVMTIRCEAGEPLTQTEGDKRSDTRLFSLETQLFFNI